MTGARYDGVSISANGPVTISGSAVGHRATVTHVAPTQEPGQPSAGNWDIGVITVLTEEANAMRAMMRGAARYRTQDRPGGLRFAEAVLDTVNGPVTLVGL